MKSNQPNIPKMLSALPSVQALSQAMRQSAEGEGDVRAVHANRLTAEGLDFSGATVHGALFQGCALRMCRWERADLCDIKFVDCDLSGCRLDSASLHRCSFQGCKLVGTGWADAVLYQVMLDMCNLSYLNGSGCSLRKVDMRQCILKGACFSEATFGTLTLHKVDLTQATIFHTPLKGLDLSECSLDDLRADPESLHGAVIDAVQAAGLIRLFGLEVREG